MRGGAARRVALAFALGLLGPIVALASTPRDTSFKPASFAAAPQLVTPSLAEELRAIEEKANQTADCVALCDIAAAVETHPFGVASAEPLNRSEDAWGNYRFTSELAPSKNRFGYTGHYWDKEASLYYAKARYYDPFTARFTQSDSFLGSIDDPPSLHRFAYGHANPTMFVDPTGHIVDKIVDQQIRDSQYTGKYRDSIGWLYNFANAARQQAGYEAANVFTFGALRRQDTLVDQNLEGKITDQQYWNRTGANAALSGVQAALTIIPGGTAATATRAIVTGATTGVIGQGVSDVGEIYGTKTKSIDDVKGSDYLLAASLGGLSGYVGYKSRPVTIEEPHTPTVEAPRSGVGKWEGADVLGRRVYQRTDLFDPMKRSAWVDEASGQWRRGTNVERMEAGLAAVDAAGRPIQLHHLTGIEVNSMTGTRGALAEVTEAFHQQNTSVLHIPELHRNPNIPQQTLPRYPSFRRTPTGGRSLQADEFDTYRAEYWRERAKGFR